MTQPPAHETIMAGSVGIMLHYATLQGASMSTLLAQAGIDPMLLTDPNTRIALPLFQKLWRLAVQATNNPALGLAMGQIAAPSTGGVVAYVMMHCPTIKVAIEKYTRYQDLICQGTECFLQTQGQQVFMGTRIVTPTITEHQQVLDSELAILYTALKNLSASRFKLEAVYFEYDQPADTLPYKEAFDGAPVHFNKAQSGLLFNAEQLSLPVINADPAMGQMFMAVANQALEALNGQEPISNKVRRYLVDQLKGHEPNLEHTAQHFAMSARNLQLKLSQEGTNFKDLLDGIRKEMATRHLRQKHSTLTDIAFLLGFSEASAFSRSFKRWTGLSPMQWRKQHVSAA